VEVTHDELLTKIKTGNEFAGIKYAPDSHTFALRAVVEVHTPIEGHEHLCGGCWFGDGMMAYPCPTILAIEKELK
jgi:hypothetical protein